MHTDLETQTWLELQCLYLARPSTSERARVANSIPRLSFESAFPNISFQRRDHAFMPFFLYVRNSSFNPRDDAVREAALNAHVKGINQLRQEINEFFGIYNWVVVV